MTRIFLNLLLILGLTVNVFSQHQKKLNVLFLGNSYTYVNNLPQLIKDLALANGDTLNFDSNCMGGYTFANHFADVTSVSKINTQQWDKVVLQAQSQEPAFSPTQVEIETLPYAIKLDSIIQHNNPCSETVFYETWGRKFGDASNCASYPPICTYAGMQDGLKQSYKLFADTTHSIFSPAGEAFRRSILLNPTLELYSGDQSHPSLEGSYLTACVFYEVLFHKSVLTNTYVSSISSSNASFLQQVAHSVVNDSLLVWNIGKYNSWAPFMVTNIGPLNYQFNTQSSSANNKWYFGDGNSSLLNSPTHLYTSSQTYTVSHVVYDNCSKDSITTVLNTLTSSVSEFNENKVNSVYPIPTNSLLHFVIDKFQVINYIVYDLLGKIQLEGKSNNTVDVSSLPNDFYFIEFKGSKESRIFKFIKKD